MSLIREHLPNFLKGLAMGIAEVIPGVSGGTIAFITGIYERLINAIKGIHPKLIRTLRKEGLGAFWKALDGTFLVALFAGMGAGIALLVNAITWCLENYPQALWAFFFGLIAASAVFIGRQIKRWNLVAIVLLIVGTVVAYYITIAAPAQGIESTWFVFLCGAIAICAMILPGISGSFLLLLMGMYAFIIGSVKALDFKTIITFGLGCAVGLISFSHVISWAFKNYRNQVLALLTGFMIGSLNKVWPWRNVLSTRTNSDGDEVPFLEQSVLPNAFDGDPMLALCIGSLIVGVLAVYLLSRTEKK